MNESLIYIENEQLACEVELNMKNVVLLDLPSSKEILKVLLKGKQPARFYAYFYKKSSDFLVRYPPETILNGIMHFC